MTATDELRRLLDERGVPWKEHRHQMPGSMQVQVETMWGQPVDQHGRLLRGIYHSRATEMADGRLFLEAQLVTPEQAIEATLGRGTCHLEINTSMTAVVCDRCNYPMPHGTVLTEVRFCPNCGRKVVTDG